MSDRLLSGFVNTYACRLTGKTPILVYQMAKVGSRSVVDSLNSHGISSVFHVHKLNPPVNNYGHRLYNNFINNKKPVDVITLVREPVGRNLSAYFGLADRYGWDVSFDLDGWFDVFKDYSFDSDPLTWFDVELKPMVGIDIYDYIFPKCLGYQVVEGDHARLLVLKLETDDKILERAISDFLSLDGFVFSRSNVTSRDKGDVSDVYSYVKDNMVFPEQYLNNMFESKYCTHFYTGGEIESFRKKYGGKM